MVPVPFYLKVKHSTKWQEMWVLLEYCEETGEHLPAVLVNVGLHMRQSSDQGPLFM